MKILYVTRHFNHSGYEILRALCNTDISIAAILLHRDDNIWRVHWLRPLLKILYRIECWYYRCEPLKTVRSEELLAIQNRIPIVWADSIKDDNCFEQVSQINPDLIVLGGGWHELIPERIFSLPALGCINTHPSLLPEFRGTSITRWQVLHGLDRSGSTIHYVDDRFDTGGVLAQKETIIPQNTTPQELFYILSKTGAEIMPSLLKRFEAEGKLKTYEVKHNKGYYKYFSRWKWELDSLRIDWRRSFRAVYYMILANSQESFRYLGPVMSLDDRSYFVRSALIREALKQSETVENQDVIVSNIDEHGVVWLGRKGEPVELGIKTVQIFDKWFRYRRSHSAAVLLGLKKGQILNLKQ